MKRLMFADKIAYRKYTFSRNDRKYTFSRNDRKYTFSISDVLYII